MADRSPLRTAGTRAPLKHGGHDATAGLVRTRTATPAEESEREITVTYEVTGDAKDVTITYSTYGDGHASQNQVTDVDPPWRKQLKTKGFVKGGRLAITTAASGGTVHCRVTADGTTRTATASGVFATAVCDGF